jgi:hypothetical protein
MYVKIDTSITSHYKFKRLCRLLQITPINALGLLASLWMWTLNNREEGNLGDLTADDLADLLDWPCGATSLLDALLECKFLDRVGSDLVLHDWCTHYRDLLRIKEATRARVQKYRERSAEEKSIDIENQHVTRYGNAVTPCNGRKGKERKGKEIIEKNLNTICGDASLVPATPPETPKKRAKKEKPEQTAGSQVWAAYVAAMQEHWRMDPPRSARTAAQAKQLAELLGVERATKLAAYFPTRRSNWYVQKGHPFGLLLTDHMALLRELENGIKFTPQVVKRIVDKEETETTCKVMELMPEENVLCMSDEEFAAWQAKKQAFLDANDTQQIGGADEVF